MEQLIELLKQIQDLAGVAIDALEGAGEDTKKEKPEGEKPPAEGEKPPAEGPPREGGEAPAPEGGEPEGKRRPY